MNLVTKILFFMILLLLSTNTSSWAQVDTLSNDLGEKFIIEPWSGKWMVEGKQEFIGTWILKQSDDKVISTKDSVYEIKGSFVGSHFKGKLKNGFWSYFFGFKYSCSLFFFNNQRQEHDFIGLTLLTLMNIRKMKSDELKNKFDYLPNIFILLRERVLWFRFFMSQVEGALR